jgi:hypothetical protein
MITLTLTTDQFRYLQEAMERDLENLEEMAPWDIDGQTDDHERDVRLCKAMRRLLGKVGQGQVFPH